VKKRVITSTEFRKNHVDQLEHGLQVTCVKWFRLQYPQLLLQSTPNAAKRTKAERGRLLAEGMITGWPDLQLAFPSNGYHALFLEMKTVKGTPSPQQLIVHAYLRSMGYAVEMPRTFEEFQKAVNAYLHP